MLESYAYDLQNQSEFFFIGLGVLFTLLGFAIGVFLRRHSQWTLTRAPHIAAWALLYAAGTAVAFAALLIPQAMEHGILWVHSASVFATITLLGLLYGVISHARALDAYGNPRKSWFGIIPFIWFDLACRKSLNPVPSSFGRNALHGLVLLAALALFGVSKLADIVLDSRLVEQAESTVFGPQVTSRLTESFIRSVGLPEALRTEQSLITPRMIDEVTWITTARAEGDTLTIHYLLDPSITTLSDHVHQELQKYHCNDPSTRAYLNAGATMAFRYIHEAGGVVAHFKIVARDCTI